MVADGKELTMKAKLIVVHANRTVIHFPVFDYKVHVELSTNLKRSEERIKRQLDKVSVVVEEDITRGGVHLSHIDLSESWLVLPYRAAPSTIAHESWHVVYRMLTRMGAGLDNETVAYHIGYLVNKIILFALRCEKENRKCQRKKPTISPLPSKKR